MCQWFLHRDDVPCCLYIYWGFTPFSRLTEKHTLSLVWSYSVYICQNAFEDVLLLNFIKEKCPKLKKNSEKSKEDFFRKSAGKHCVISKPYIWLVEKRTILAVLYFRSQYCTLWLKESPWYKKIEIYWSKIN